MTLFIVGVCARVSVCLPACLDLCPRVTCSGSDCRSACNRFTSRFILCIHVFLWPCVSLCLCVFISLSLTERTSAGARDKSPEEVGSGWGEAGEKGGKKDRQDRFRTSYRAWGFRGKEGHCSIIRKAGVQ